MKICFPKWIMDFKTQMSEPVQLCFNPFWMQSLKQWQLCTPKYTDRWHFPVWERRLWLSESLRGVSSELLSFFNFCSSDSYTDDVFSCSTATQSKTGENIWIQHRIGDMACWRQPGYHKELDLEAWSNKCCDWIWRNFHIIETGRFLNSFISASSGSRNNLGAF